MNSALIYRYFKDIDEIILYACVHALQEYTREMNDARIAYESSVSEVSDKDLYLLSWELFSKHAFSNPEEYSTLFFNKHSSALPNIIRDYHELFPHEAADDADIVLEGMYRTSSMRDRNFVLLIPVLEGRKSEQDIILINDMTVAYFASLLTQITGNPQSTTPERQTERMMKACTYLIET
jgi:AcrR family transcriptional regulator